MIIRVQFFILVNTLHKTCYITFVVPKEQHLPRPAQPEQCPAAHPPGHVSECPGTAGAARLLGPGTVPMEIIPRKVRRFLLFYSDFKVKQILYYENLPLGLF